MLGTDVFGHDLLTQVIGALQGTLGTAAICAAVCTVGGVILGALAGYYGGWIDAVVSWVTAVVIAIPAIAVLMVVFIWSKLPLTPLDNALWLSTVLWAGPARITRATVRAARTREFVEAARAAGASDARIIVRHLMPNAFGPILVAATSLVAQEIVIMATVNYLGYSIDQNFAPTLGGLIAEATQAPAMLLFVSKSPFELWWMYAVPTLALVALLMSIAFLADSLDDALAPASA